MNNTIKTALNTQNQNRKTQSTLRLIMGMLSIAFLASHALAGPGGRESNSRRRMQDMEQTVAVVNGTLSCKMPEKNTGEACAVSIVDSSTKNTYTLVENGLTEDLRKAYNSGKRTAHIKGYPRSNDKFRIKPYKIVETK